MFQALDTMISLGVIFLILSMVNKYLISLVKRIFKIKAKAITKEMETFIGKKTSKYLIPYLEERAKHLNFLDNTNIKKKIVLRQLNKEQLKDVVGKLEEFLNNEDNDTLYIIKFLQEKAKDINIINDRKLLRQLDEKQFKNLVGKLNEFLGIHEAGNDKLDKFLKNKDTDDFKKIFGIFDNGNKVNEKLKEINEKIATIKRDIKEEIDEVKAHLFNLKYKVDKMYDNTMEKISEVYETKLRYRALYFGIALAFIINADLFGIYNSLSKSPAIRAQLIDKSEDIRKEMNEISKKIMQDEKKPFEDKEQIIGEIKEINRIISDVESKGIVLGWTSEKYNSACSSFGSIVYKLIGLLIAGLLISFGAPFWHDFIGTFTGIRKTLRGNKEENKKKEGGGGAT